MSTTFTAPASKTLRSLRPDRPRRRAPVVFAMLTHGALEATRRCIATLLQTTPLEHEVVVLDNASTDGTVQWLQALEVPTLHPFASPSNLGVAGGRNALLQLIRPFLPADGHVVFVDNDLEFLAGWTEPFRELFARWEGAGIAGVAGHEIVVGADRRTLLPAPLRTGPVDVVSGGFACWVRAAVIDAIGGFDERTGPFWHEDDDLCVRALAAGWEVFAVPEAAVRHHEHQSGVALPDLESGGSLDNQRYLAEKWRAAGWVDAQGWVVRPSSPFYAAPEERQRLRDLASWPRSPGRAELGQAAWDVERLYRAEDPQREAELRPPSRSTLHDAVLERRRDAAAVGTPARERLDLVAAVLARASAGAWLRPRVAVPVDDAPRPRSAKLCDLRDWDDAGWLAAAERLSPGGVERDWPFRHRAVWEQVQVLQALERAGVLQEDAVGLSVGAGREPLLWHLPRRVRLLVATDLYDRRAEEAFGVPCELPREPERFAPHALPSGRLAVLAQDARLLELGDTTFDFAVAIGLLHDCGSFEDAVRIVLELARVVKPGGIVVVASDVVVDGRPLQDAFTPGELGGGLFEGTGMELVEPLDATLASATLEGFDPSGGDSRPHAIAARGDSLVTSAVVVLRVSDPVRPAAVPRAAAARTVAVDARTFAYVNSTTRGIGHYTASHLDAVARARPDWRLLCYGGDVMPRGVRSLLALPNVDYERIDRFDPEAVDLVHVPDPMNLSAGFDSPLRILRGVPTTVTFHDLIPLRCYWQSFERDQRAVYLDRLRQVRQSDAVVLTNSEHTRADLLQTLRLDPQRVIPVLAGLNRGMQGERDPGAAARVRARLGLDGPFFLHVGALDGHKNFEGVLAAFRRVAPEHPCRLVVAGPRDAGAMHFRRLCAEEGLAGVIFAGFLPRSELEALYAEATALVFLSLYEGFGFPALEAMARGCPVLASSSSSLPEVVGDAGLLVHPRDTDAAARAMRELLMRPELRDDLARRGRDRAPTFTWERVAERTLEVWERLAVSRR